MKIAFIIFNGMTVLDFIGVYDPLVRLKTMGFLPEIEWETCAVTKVVRDNTGLVFRADKVGTSLSAYDLLIVPGGFGTRSLAKDPLFIEWLKSAKPCPLKASVCTGSLLLGAAGYLQGKKATTHPNAYHELEKYCLQVLDKRIVDEGEVITARGVTASLDLGIYLCEKLAGGEIKEKIRIQIDWFPA